ncbi:MAG TPA: carboxypeptidase regulatory-like domain-containing protein [Micropepsaceae bacterium]|nr:carboxypeptidase regulatory-like domain-containing protein [Micropepsaceae bacterium]
MSGRMITTLLSAVAAAALLNVAGASAQTGAAITGTVSSAQEGNMEGVIVTAKKDGAHIAISVVSDDKGHYAFPADRLEPGHYNIKIRAIGYIPSTRFATDVAAGKTASLDLKLNKTDNIAAQLTSAEWLASMPGTDDQKAFLQDCTTCHTLIRPLSSGFTAEDFMQVIPRMGTYAPGSQPQRPQKLLPGPRGNRGIVDATKVKAAAEYLASVNLSTSETYKYPLQTFPRPTGRATHVIYTTYDLARPEAMPHDVIYLNGKIWYTDFGSQFVGEMDPKTGKIVDHPIPVLKPDEPKGVLELKPDQDGNLWASMMYQGGIARIDAKTGDVKTYKVPDQWQGPNTQESMVSPEHWHVDGYVWTNNQEDHSILRVNVKTGEWENLGVLKDPKGRTINGYDIPTDEQNNLYLLEFGGTKIGKIDAKTKTLQTWDPDLPHARPRRGHFDENGTLWYAEYGSNAVGRFDPKTQTITEWQMQVKWQMPYDALATKKGDVYTGSVMSDRVVRLDPKTGQQIVYLMPASTNIRRVNFDEEHGALWVGSNHGNAIVKMEPLD